MNIWLYSLLFLVGFNLSVDSFVSYRPFLLHIFTFKTPHSVAVMNGKSVANCGLQMRNGVNQEKSRLYGRNKESAKGSSLFVPRSDNQKEYLESLLYANHSLVIGIGPAGCGKTMFACQAAISALKKGSISKIVVTRPFVAVDQESMGFLPGSIDQKMSPWTRPIFDIFELFYSKKEITAMLEESVIEMAPLAYMRGRTFRNTWIIADEMQNSSPNQMVMLLTRVGEGSKIAVTGDLQQSDLGKGNGLADFLRLVKKRSYVDSSIRIVELGTGDVQRSDFVRSILSIYSGDKENVVSENNVVSESNSSINSLINESTVSSSNISVRSVLPIDNDCALIPKQYWR